MHDSVSIRPDRPFFLYFAFGATHAPHQAPAEYLAKYRGAFDDGWDVARERLVRPAAIEMGLFPRDTQLAPRNPGVAGRGTTLPENHRRLAARLQEAFAAFLDHTDAQIGRLVAALEHLGAARQHHDRAALRQRRQPGGRPVRRHARVEVLQLRASRSPDDAIATLDDIGGPNSHTNYPWGWAQAGNTPFKWYKQNTHEGGVHVPLIVHWPQRDRAPSRGGLRDQFHHVNDIAPTIYDVLGVTPPAGVPRLRARCRSPARSMRYTLADAGRAVAASRCSTSR